MDGNEKKVKHGVLIDLHITILYASSIYIIFVNVLTCKTDYFPNIYKHKAIRQFSWIFELSHSYRQTVIILICESFHPTRSIPKIFEKKSLKFSAK